MSLPAQAGEQQAQVILLHGLARSDSSMAKLASALKDAGYAVCNIDYPSRKHDIPELANQFVLPAIRACDGYADGARLDFVTHSLGGIIVRQLEAGGVPFNFGRVVMLGPPNGGSEVVDKLGRLPPFRWLNGPAGSELGTSNEATPVALGPTALDVGVVAGSRTINVILSMLIPGSDDGKVSIENARLDGMRDFAVVSASHPYLMKDLDAIAQVLHYLATGRFDHGLDSGN